MPAGRQKSGSKVLGEQQNWTRRVLLSDQWLPFLPIIATRSSDFQLSGRSRPSFGIIGRVLQEFIVYRLPHQTAKLVGIEAERDDLAVYELTGAEQHRRWRSGGTYGK